MLFSTGFHGNKIVSVPVQKIHPNPHQTRRVFDPEELSALAESIRQNGVLQPLTVRKSDDGYELIAGERRLRALQKLGVEKAPCVICNVDGEQSAVLCLLENLQRQDLNCFEEAEGLALLISQYHLTQKEVAERLGKQQSTVANKLRLLKLSTEHREKILSSNLTERHARALLLVEEPLRSQILEKIVEKNLTVAETERWIEQSLAPEKPRKKPIIVVKDVRIFLNTLAHAVAVMKTSGLQVTEEKSETEEYLEYTVRIANPTRKKSRSA